MGTSTHFGCVSVAMISTGRRWVVASLAAGVAGAAACLLFHAHAETSGAERKTAMASGLSGLEEALIDGK